MQNKLITMVIPTRNRPAHLNRLLKYLSQVNCDFTIFVSDSSKLENQLKSQTEAIVKSYLPKLDVHYFYSDEESHYPLKFFRTVSRITTPYAVLCADDDLLIPASVLKCVEFLEAHSDYALANGHTAMFKLKDGAHVHGTIASLTQYPQSSIVEDSASARLLHHCAVYRVSMYSVQRTKLLIEAWDYSSHYNLEFGELAPSMHSLIQGKRANLDLIYMLREEHAARDTNAPNDDVFTWIGSPKWSHESKTFIESMRTLLVKYEKISMEQAWLVARHAFWVYITDRLASSLSLPLSIPFLTSPERTYALPPDEPRMQLDALTSKRSSFSQDFGPVYSAIMG